MISMKDNFTIGKLAKAANVGVETIRFYEKKLLLKQPRKVGAFRNYPIEYVERIKFIKRAQELGFTLKETSELLTLKLTSKSKCSDVLLKTNKKILEIEKKIIDLKVMKASLENLANCCDNPDVSLSECSMLDIFTSNKRKEV